MRATILVVGFAYLISFASADPPKKDEPAFDEKDVMKTLHWMCGELTKSRDFPPNNEVAGKAAAESYLASMKKVGSGQKVTWVVELGRVEADGRLALRLPATKDEAMYFRSAPPDIKAEKIGTFPVGKPEWLTKVGEGDKLILAGKIAEIRLIGTLSTTEPKKAHPAQWEVYFESFEIVPVPVKK